MVLRFIYDEAYNNTNSLRKWSNRKFLAQENEVLYNEITLHMQLH